MKKENSLELKKLSPVLFTDDIPSCIPFWTKIGFEKTAEVPDDTGKLQFIILAKDNVEIMYQTYSSIATDMPGLKKMKSSIVLYIEVSDLNTIINHLDDAPVVVNRRKTFYGSHEIGLREPSGSVVIFSEH